MSMRRATFYPALALASSLMVLFALSTSPTGAFALTNMYWGSNNNFLSCAKQSELYPQPATYQPCTIGVDTTQLNLPDWTVNSRPM